MYFYVSLQSFNLRLHLIVLVEQLLCLLGLVLELSGQLMVLEDGQTGGGLELLVIECQQVCFGLFDLVEHVFPQLLCCLDLLSLLLIDLAIQIQLILYLFTKSFPSSPSPGPPSAWSCPPPA
jgi:hypothetical protein